MYKDSSSWQTGVIGEKVPAEFAADEAIAAARDRLARYISRRGVSPSPGLSRPGLPLRLMIKDDGTAMGALP